MCKSSVYFGAPLLLASALSLCLLWFSLSRFESNEESFLLDHQRGLEFQTVSKYKAKDTKNPRTRPRTDFPKTDPLEGQSCRSMLTKRKDESIWIIHAKSKELSIVDIRNKKQRIKINIIDAEMPTQIFILFFIRMH